MSYSTRDELAEIERLARGGPSSSSRPAPAPVVKKKGPKPTSESNGPRRGSSLFSGPGAMSAVTQKAKGLGVQKDGSGDDLLVDFPRSDDEGGLDESEDERMSGSKQTPNPHLMKPSGGGTGGPGGKPVGGLGGLKDFDDSDFDSDEDQSPKGGLPGQPLPLPNAGKKQQQPPRPVGPVTGSQMNRPYVGGFAAAAYEAARAYHFDTSEQTKDGSKISKDKGRTLPSI
mmetsp:Transcript_11354/g.13721  ORF Transcript_11354/g.13721 Transcript_11354/m.13721 type:complete len:228 (+) Transcript_11354:216-899(+)|eukprot:CAMPEP_0195264930 /NCGR_PEP_ID=MMETSP0706-20130129/11134_1 /TAXON_ID=33640 /ORGANISM="Asterionellopsis glacialis, Strain CCMP134" /LENGTH=227 /DNA_ID=CAMNT_0040319277 /DNA_START=193 /DNA_END=876 /DNA_ORIENTATION=+